MRTRDPVVIHTRRLDLIAATLEHIQAELESTETLAAMLGVDIDPSWPPGEYDRDAQEFFRDRLAEGGVSAVGWYSWYAVRRKDDAHMPVLIGAGGYLGPPNDTGEVEIGFSIMPGWRNQGYAAEIAQALVSYASADRRVRKILAHADSGNPASQKVLRKAGFRFVHHEEESGMDLFQWGV